MPVGNQKITYGKIENFLKEKRRMSSAFGARATEIRDREE
jgi:hypothetical protein